MLPKSLVIKGEMNAREGHYNFIITQKEEQTLYYAKQKGYGQEDKAGKLLARLIKIEQDG